MIETYQISSKFAREIETALIESFYDAFGKNVKDCLGEIIRGGFIYPPEPNTIFLEEYSYKGFCFLRVKGVAEINDKEITFKLQTIKYKPNYGNS
jgi:hypothetical protein